MTHLPASRELQPLTQSKSPRSPQTAWGRVIAAINRPEFLIIVVVCLLGLLLTLNFMFRHPDVGELIQQYNLF
jgi:hypothetical protein